MNKKYLLLISSLLLLFSLFSAACGSSTTTTTTSSSSSAAPSQIVIAYGQGLSYASLVILKQEAILEKEFPQTHFEWKIMSSGSVIRDGMIAGHIQVGSGGIGPFLIGWDKGVNLRMVAALSKDDFWLVAKDPKIKSLKDITSGMKIGVPALDSIQAVAVRKAAQQALGNAHALDSNLIVIDNPTAVQGLVSGQLAAHMASAPFQFQEVQQGGHILVKSSDLFGKTTFSEAFVTQSFYDQYPSFIKKLYQNLQDATQLLKTQPDRAAELLSQDQKGSTPAQNKAWLQRSEISYDTTPAGFLTYARFMQSIGLMSKVPNSISDLELPILNGAGN